MNKCSPVEMRKNLEMVNAYKVIGIDFIPIPVRNDEHKKELIIMSHNILEEKLKEYRS